MRVQIIGILGKCEKYSGCIELRMCIILARSYCI